jgi:hypothetical protein
LSDAVSTTIISTVWLIKPMWLKMKSGLKNTVKLFQSWNKYKKMKPPNCDGKRWSTASMEEEATVMKPQIVSLIHIQRS